MTGLLAIDPRLIVVAFLIVHETVPRTVPVHRVRHCLCGRIFPTTGLASLQSFLLGRMKATFAVSSLLDVKG